jgi:hypothetical protein
MRRNSAVLSWVTLVLGAGACAGQEPPHPAAPPGPAAGQPGAGETSRWVPLGGRDPYPPPLPAVVDPRTGAWRQVYVPPGACVGQEPWVAVGGPCPRCGQKLLHPFHGRLQGALRGRHARPGDGVPGDPPGPDAEWAPADPGVAQLLPPRLPAAGNGEGRK